MERNSRTRAPQRERSNRQPAGLPLGGTLLCTLALFLLIIGVVALTQYLDHIKKSRGMPANIRVNEN